MSQTMSPEPDVKPGLWHRHTWGRWEEVWQMMMRMSGGAPLVYDELWQKRECATCGKVQMQRI